MSGMSRGTRRYYRSLYGRGRYYPRRSLKQRRVTWRRRRRPTAGRVRRYGLRSGIGSAPNSMSAFAPIPASLPTDFGYFAINNNQLNVDVAHSVSPYTNNVGWTDNGLALTSEWQWAHLTGFEQGTGVSQRLESYIRLDRIKIYMQFQGELLSLTDPLQGPTWVRVAVLRAARPIQQAGYAASDTIPSALVVAGSGFGFADANYRDSWFDPDRWDVLYDKRINLCPYGQTATIGDIVAGTQCVAQMTRDATAVLDLDLDMKGMAVYYNHFSPDAKYCMNPVMLVFSSDSDGGTHPEVIGHVKTFYRG